MHASEHFAKDAGKLYVGMLVTEHGYSDRYGAVVVWVSKSRKQAFIVYTDNDGKVIGQPSGVPIRLASDGQWYLEGATGSARKSLTLGCADNFYDFSF